MEAFKLDSNQSKIVGISKHWKVWSDSQGDIKEDIARLYSEYYSYDKNAEGIFSMVSDLYFRFLAFLFKEDAQLAMNRLSQTIDLTFPDRTWEVGGKRFRLFPDKQDSLNSEEMHWAWILSILSFFRNLEGKYFEFDKEVYKCYLKSIKEMEEKIETQKTT